MEFIYQIIYKFQDEILITFQAAPCREASHAPNKDYPYPKITELMNESIAFVLLHIETRIDVRCGFKENKLCDCL